MNIITPEQAAITEYDVVIVGGGISGAIVAKTLTQAGKRCLIVEAGTGIGVDYQGYLDYLNTFYTATIKIPNAPYPVNPNAPEPLETEVAKIPPDRPNDKGYFVQCGPLPYSSTYTRYLGGTTLHWLGTSLRMLPEDFHLKSLYGVGIDWPISYQDLEPWYREAERELGVSANVDEQSYLGVTFPTDYVYPMHGLPASWSDKQLASRIDGMQVEDDGQSYTLKVRGTPASRNGIPNAAYNHGHGYQPKGAVGNASIGHRCMGNSSCVPICPIQAKYSALKTLDAANHDKLDILLRSVAYQLTINPDSKEIADVQFKHYLSPQDPTYTLHRVRGKRYVLAAHAVANAILLLASDACKGNDLVGRHLMDHPELLTWGLASTPMWPLRGPLATSGIEDLRGGSFRKYHAPYRFEMGNDGWLWPTGAPLSNVLDLVDNQQQFGKALRQQLEVDVSRQFRFGILVEQLPEYENRVTIDPAYKDALGNYRPVIHYDLSPYTRAGFSSAFETAMAIFDKAGIKNCSNYPKEAAGAFTCPDGKTLTFNGAGHFAGTHCMGDSPGNSVVNKYQRTWEHSNLYLVGCGNMINMGTSNPTLTMSALTCWAAHNILQDLNGEPYAAN
ncbi:MULTISPECIES: GMC family oxidoreductase [unclassified Serratia (in: enterobacteria)]|uniref:GMC family oxidoreductase n=1 Tax=unclassified Serratia (in: enterobacteria) TaxID=2647522 RepID=UPI0030761EF8